MKTTRAALLATASLAVLLQLGCSKEAAPAATTKEGLAKIKVGYIGLTCEAPLFAAVENGFFKEEGLEPELVKCEWSKYKDVLALGGFDITHHLIMYFLKPIEQGLDVRMTGGVHTGCLRVQAGVKTDIHTVEDLKGKRIGVPGMGTPPFIFANRVLVAHGMDASKDVEWRVFPAGELGLALEKGEVDAVATSEPIGTMLIAEGKVRKVADQALDDPYKDEYCCVVISNGKWVMANKDLAARGTRAILKGSRWVQENPRAAAHMAVEKKYLASNPELNTSALATLNYMPSIAGAEKAIASAAAEMKIAGMLSPTTDVAELVKKAWLPLDGVTDEWVRDLKVEKVAGGQIPSDQPQRLLAELKGPDAPVAIATCCAPKSKIVRQ
jgi:NitT/TauT family transport system substrate-binding protein